MKDYIKKRLNLLCIYKMVKRTKSVNQESRSALSLITEICSESNAHGFARIANTRKKKRKALWGIFVALGVSAAMVQLSLLVMKYIEFQVVEVSKIRHGMPVLYPSVTVCSIAAASLTKTKKRMTNPNGSMRKWIEFLTAIKNQRMNSIQAFYENIEDEVRLIAYDIDEFILHCTFNKMKCSADNFTLHFDGSHYYNCFTFNRGSTDKKKELLMQATGPQYGLSLILALDNDDSPPGYYGVYNINSNIENAAGVRVSVHEPNTIPFPVDHGFDVPPGYTTSVSLKASLHSRLGKPYGNCTNQMLSGGQEYKHTIFSCLQVCQQEIVVKSCGCKASGLPNPKSSKNLTNCGTLIGWQGMVIERNNSNLMSEEDRWVLNSSFYTDKMLKNVQCEQDVLYNLANDRSYEKGCKCYQPCSELRYEKSISLSYWPLEFYQFHILELLMKDRMNDSFLYDAYSYLKDLSKYAQSNDGKQIENAKDRDNQLKASKLIRQNLVRLNIYIEDLSVVEFKQMPAYELADLFADIGGTLGLWMGISVLTFVELMELLLRLLILLLSAERKPARTIGNGSLDRETDYSYERTYDSDIETPV